MKARLVHARAGVLLFALLITGCRPLYIPLVPEPPQSEAHTQLSSASELLVAEGRPVLRLALRRVAVDEGAWLDVQWFDPRNALAASESTWVTGSDVGRVLTFALPDDVTASDGEWRAVVSQGGVYLRQFRVDLAADPEEN